MLFIVSDVTRQKGTLTVSVNTKFSCYCWALINQESAQQNSEFCQGLIISRGSHYFYRKHWLWQNSYISVANIRLRVTLGSKSWSLQNHNFKENQSQWNEQRQILRLCENMRWLCPRGEDDFFLNFKSILLCYSSHHIQLLLYRLVCSHKLKLTESITLSLFFVISCVIQQLETTNSSLLCILISFR